MRVFGDLVCCDNKRGLDRFSFLLGVRQVNLTSLPDQSYFIPAFPFHYVINPVIESYLPYYNVSRCITM